MEYLSDEQKEIIRENNQIIDDNNSAESQLERIKEAVNDMKEQLRPPNPLKLMSEATKRLTGRSPTEIIADDLIGSIHRRSLKRKISKHVILNFFNRR